MIIFSPSIIYLIHKPHFRWRKDYIVPQMPNIETRKIVVLRTKHVVNRFEATQMNIPMEDLVHHRIKNTVDEELMKSTKQFITYTQEEDMNCITVRGELSVYKKD